MSNATAKKKRKKKMELTYGSINPPPPPPFPQTHTESSAVIKPTLAVKLKLVNDTARRAHTKSFLYPDEIANIIPALHMYPISPGDHEKTLKKKKESNQISYWVCRIHVRTRD